jgi:hypothetical protein
MHPDISEFSYGYALTESLVAAAPMPIRAAPVFPSLLAEGQPGGGYDVHLPFAGFPLFLQFKLAHRMVRASAHEAGTGLLSTPFYRMHLRPTRHSQQHPMLLELEDTGVAVYYAAPYFHTPAELNRAYEDRRIVHESLFVKPSEIGPLPDDKDHHLAYRRGTPVYFCSKEPRPIREAETEPLVFLKELAVGHEDRKLLEPNQQSVRLLADQLEAIVRRRQRFARWMQSARLEKLKERNEVSRLAYLARTFFGCNVVIVAPATSASDDAAA